MADEGEKKIVGANNIKKGNYVIIDGVACATTDVEISRPGKHGHSKVKITAIGLLDDKKRVIVMPGHDNIEVPIVNKRNAQVLSIQGNTANVMDSETYETFDLKIPEEMQGQVSEGMTVLYWSVLGQKVMKQTRGGSE